MTSASDTVSSANDPFAQGAGFVNPNRAADPGLVYPTTAERVPPVHGQPRRAVRPAVRHADADHASNLNQASIAVGKLAGTETVTRRVKNVGDASATYTATATVPGFDVVVTPSALTLAPGAEQTFTVKFTRAAAIPPRSATGPFGSLTWSGGGHAVRSPIALEPVAVSAPDRGARRRQRQRVEEFQIMPGSTDAARMSVVRARRRDADRRQRGCGVRHQQPGGDADTKVYHVVVAGRHARRRGSRSTPSTTPPTSTCSCTSTATSSPSRRPARPTKRSRWTTRRRAPTTSTSTASPPRAVDGYDLANFVVGSADAGNLDAHPQPGSASGDTGRSRDDHRHLDRARRGQAWFGVISFAGSDVVTFFSVG